MSPVPNVSSEIGYFPYPIGSERKPYFVKTENGKSDLPVFLQVSLPRLGHRLSYFRSNVQSRYVSIFISAQRWWTPFFLVNLSGKDFRMFLSRLYSLNAVSFPIFL